MKDRDNRIKLIPKSVQASILKLGLLFPHTQQNNNAGSSMRPDVFKLKAKGMLKQFCFWCFGLSQLARKCHHFAYQQKPASHSIPQTKEFEADAHGTSSTGLST